MSSSDLSGLAARENQVEPDRKVDTFLKPPRRGDKDWIQTFSGKRFYPLDPDPSDLDWESIAHALSNICRYTGHVRTFYSVAEHSVRVSLQAEKLAGDHPYCKPTVQCPQKLSAARQGLLHDASEAYLCDIARPVKRSPQMEGYRQAEDRLQRMIYVWAGLPDIETREVGQADMDVYETEKRDLMSPRPDWPPSPGNILPEIIKPLPPGEAAYTFMLRARSLGLWR